MLDGLPVLTAFKCYAPGFVFLFGLFYVFIACHRAIAQLPLSAM
jgi:hypothetical protein